MSGLSANKTGQRACRKTNPMTDVLLSKTHFLSTVIQSMSEAASIITFSQSGELLFEAINPAFETVLGRSDDEVRGMPFNQFFEPTLSLMSSSVESNVVLNSCGFV